MFEQLFAKRQEVVSSKIVCNIFNQWVLWWFYNHTIPLTYIGEYGSAIYIFVSLFYRDIKVECNGKCPCTCERRCISTNTVISPVCDINNKTYESECHAECQ